MKILKYKDCERTQPPSTTFIFFPEVESDLAFIAELVDLPTANRTMQSFPEPEQVEDFNLAQQAGRTARIGLQSLYDHLQNSPSSTELYARKAIFWATTIFKIDEDTLLKKAFWIRNFHF